MRLLRYARNDFNSDFQLTYQDSFGYGAVARHHIAFYDIRNHQKKLKFGNTLVLLNKAVVQFTRGSFNALNGYKI